MSARKEQPCSFCHTKVEDEVNLGPLRFLKDVRVHYYCILLSSNITQSGTDNQGILGFTLQDIKSDIRRCRDNICIYCKKNNANLKCMADRKCSSYFHLPCGLRNKTLHEFSGKYKSYCHRHRRIPYLPENVRLNLSDNHCLICYDSFDKSVDHRDLYVSKCCNGRAILHVNCVKQFALSAGYFTKCPICNNVQTFVSDIKCNGVFVPNRDASWERERNAYGELLERYSKCDAKDCSCPHKQRNKYMEKDKRKPWYILTCQTCGGSGMHNFCNNLQSTYVCKTCKFEQSFQVEEEEPEIKEEPLDENLCDVTRDSKKRKGKIVVFDELLECVVINALNDGVKVLGFEEPGNGFLLNGDLKEYTSCKIKTKFVYEMLDSREGNEDCIIVNRRKRSRRI